MFSLVGKAFADTNAANVPLPADPLTGEWTSIGGMLTAAVNITFYISLAVVVMFLMIGGIKYATSGGDPKSAAAAKQTITNALIGALIVIAFRALLAFIITVVLGGNDFELSNFKPGF